MNHVDPTVCQKPFISFVVAINFSDQHELRDLLLIIDAFIDNKRFQEACDICLSLVAMFPMV